MQDFRRLRAWQAAHRAAVATYRVSDAFPREEAYGLKSQLCRAVASIGANIAEGCGRASDADSKRCFQIALGSACEALNHAMLARDIGLLREDQFDAIETELQPTRRMLIRLIEAFARPNR
jgi:four helix bundle protein